MFKNVNTAVLLWAGLALLLLAAIYAPVSRSTVGDEPAHIARMDAFSPLVVEVDDRLRAGSPTGLDADELDLMTPILESRRLLEAGSMTVEELQIALDLLREFKLELDNQRDEASRGILRRQRARVLAERFPRLVQEKIASNLEELREQLEDAAEISPRRQEQP